MTKKWEQLLLDVRRIRGKSNGLLFDRVNLLVDVYADGDFLAFHGGSVDKAQKQLDGELGDFGIDFFDAKAMLELHPKRATWENGNVKQMLADTIEHNAAKAKERNADNAPVITRKRPTIAEYEESEKRAEQANQRCESLMEEVARLRAENRRLTAELARAEGRISELERMVRREYAAT